MGGEGGEKIGICIWRKEELREKKEFGEKEFRADSSDMTQKVIKCTTSVLYQAHEPGGQVGRVDFLCGGTLLRG